jgi:5-formyltetrahydrofolate cyclo-ligase
MSGYRLGRGKGYYDKLLTQATGKKCGICFECQIVDELPVENHDVKMNYVITPSLIVEFK